MIEERAGCILGVAYLGETQTFWTEKLAKDELGEWVNHSAGRCAHPIRDVITLKNVVPCKGSIGIWKLLPNVEEEIRLNLPDGTRLQDQICIAATTIETPPKV